MRKVGSEIRRLEARSYALGLKKKYELEPKDCSIKPKIKSKIALLGPRFLFDRSCLQTLVNQLLVK